MTSPTDAAPLDIIAFPEEEEEEEEDGRKEASLGSDSGENSASHKL